jgi:hypothetical protein
MKKIFIIWTIALVCVIAIKGFTRAENVNTKITSNIMSKSEAGLRSAMRALWESRAALLRAYIVNDMNDSKDADEARDKLLKNAGDLGASIQPYYGYWARGILTGLLKKDVLLTAEVIKAAKLGNKVNLDWNKANWYANALLLAGFFAITHNQTKADLTAMLYKHLDLTWGEIESRLKKDEEKDLNYYEKDHAHMIMFSDVLTDGLIKQFPGIFKD